MGDDLSDDDAFALLQNSRRRNVLEYLTHPTTDEPVTLSELSVVIAAHENDIEIDDVDSDQRHRIYTSLYQTHLPRLDKHDGIDYDKQSGRVHQSENTDYLINEIERAKESIFKSASSESILSKIRSLWSRIVDK